MKILFLDAYFNPELIAFTHLENDLIKEIVDAGHEIDILCPIPVRGVKKEVRELYKKKRYEEIYDGRVRIHRFWAPNEANNKLIRAIRYFWCNIREYQLGSKFKDIDLIFSNSTPPTQGLIAGFIGKKNKIPFLYSLQDIFPDSLITTGITKKNTLLWKIGVKIEKKTYALSKHIVVISNSCYKNLISKGIEKDKISLIPNWVDTDSIKEVKKGENDLFQEYKIDSSKYLVVYAGNFGAAQGAEVILETAKILQDYKDIQFVVFGGGSNFDNAVQYVKENNLCNLIINPLLPQERVSEVYSLGDVVLVTCKAGVGKSGMPSKVWNIMACNKPIIASFDLESELADILAESSCGICVSPENAEKLAIAILEQKNKGSDVSVDGRSYIEANVSRKICTSKYIEKMEEIVIK